MVKNPPAKAGDTRDPWVRKMLWREEQQPTPVLLPGKSHGQRSLAGYSPRGRKELDMTKQLILLVKGPWEQLTEGLVTEFRTEKSQGKQPCSISHV